MVQAKAIVIDTDNLDLDKLAEVFGQEAADAISEALGLDEATCDDCDCESDDEPDEDLEEDEDYGLAIYQNENDERVKVVLSCKGTNRSDIDIRVGHGGMISVAAEKTDGSNTFSNSLEMGPKDDSYFIQDIGAILDEDGELTIRAFKRLKSFGVGDVIAVS
jgi:hypothetical protein